MGGINDRRCGLWWERFALGKGCGRGVGSGHLLFFVSAGSDEGWVGGDFGWTYGGARVG